MNVLVGFHPIPMPTRRHAYTRKPSVSCCCSLKRKRVGAGLFGCGFLIGPLIDGIHSSAKLVVYENGSIDIGPLHTNVWVPPLLGLFYATVGLLQLFLDDNFPRSPPPPPPPENGFQKVLASLLALVVLIALSGELYKAGVSENVEGYILFAGAELMWLAFDRSRLGFALACLVGVACPLAEIPIMELFHLWYYPHPNIYIMGQA